MALVEIELPNGAVLEMDEAQATPERIKTAWLKIQRDEQALDQEFKKSYEARKATAEAPLTQGAKYVGQKALKGLTFFPTMMLDALVPRHPAQEEWSEEINRMGTRPATRGQRYAGAAAEGVTSAMTGGPAALERPILTTLQGMGGGAGAEAGADIGGEGPVQRLLGGLVGGVTPTVPYAFMGHKEDLAKIALRDVNPEDLKRATRTQYEGLDEGLRLTLSQSMDNPSNIDRIAQELMNMEAGTQTQAAVRAQPVQATAALKKYGLKLPGETLSQRGAANLAQEASTDAIKQAQKFRQAEFERVYADGGQVRLPTRVMDTVDQRLAQLQRQYPGQGVADQIGDLREALRNRRLPARDFFRLFDYEVGDTPTAGDISRGGGTFINQVEELAGILRSQKAQLKGPNLKAKPLSAEEAVKFKEAYKILQEEMERFSPKYAAANARYRELSSSTVNPLKKGPVGDLAGKGANEVDAAAKTKAYSMFDAGTVPGHGKGSDILTLEREWRKAGRGEDFATVAKSWLSQRIAEASKSLGNRVDPDRAKSLYTALAGDEMQKQGLRDVLVGMARSQGIDNEHEYAEGFMNFMKILGAAARRPGESAGLPGEVIEQTGRNPVSWFLKLFSIVPFSEAAGATKRLYSEKAFSVMDDLMTRPEGVEQLKRLAREPIVSKKAQTIVNTLITSMATERGDFALPAEKRAEMTATPPRGKPVLPTDLPYFPGMTEAR